LGLLDDGISELGWLGDQAKAIDEVNNGKINGMGRYNRRSQIDNSE
jgi:hypothetical protein